MTRDSRHSPEGPKLPEEGGSGSAEWRGGEANRPTSIASSATLGEPMPEARELKPCPFCGGEAKLLFEPPVGLNSWRAACLRCGVRTATYADEKPATAVWNTRALSLSTDARNDAWLPIETAPKDGDDILLHWGGDTACQIVGHWDEDREEPYKWGTLDGPYYHQEAFSHWRPLPEPPQASLRRGGDGG